MKVVPLKISLKQLRMKLIWTKAFIRKYAKWEKKHSNLSTKARERLSLFSVEPFHRSLRTHALVNELDGYWSFSINYKYRVVFSFNEDKTEAVLLNIGSHDEVY